MSDRINIAEGHDSTNTISSIEYYKLICSTCKHIYEILETHCGPYANDALIITDNNRSLKDKHYAIFTKDGINIVKSIEFVSPIQKHIQYLISYIGERVDSLSHDGTTTSMMLFVKFVELVFTRIIAAEENNNLLDRRSIKANILNGLTELFDKLKGDVITLERLQKDFNISKSDATKFVAYHQAMLSSKGDVELSTAIAEVVETLPIELYGHFTVSQSGLETDKRFTVIKDDFDFVLPVQSNIDDMNYKMGTEYFAEKCDLIVSEDDLVPGNPSLEIIVKHVGRFHNEAFPVNIECTEINIEENTFVIGDQSQFTDLKAGTAIQLMYQDNPIPNGLWIYNGQSMPITRPDKTKDLVIITKSIDANLFAQIKTINKKSTNKIIIFPMSITNPYSSKCTILSALLNTAGVYHMDEHLEDTSREYLIRDAKVHLKNRRLYVSNLYKRDDSGYHPFYNNPEEFEPYTKMVSDIKFYLNEHASGRIRVESAQDNARYLDYVEIYRRMVCTDVKHLQISGLTHDVLADRDVLQDSFGAVLASLEFGFVIDGYLKLNSYFVEEPFDSSNVIHEAFSSILVGTHKRPLSEITQVLLDLSELTPTPYCFYPVGGSLTELCGINPNDMMVIRDIKGNATTLVIQPMDTYRELFKRLSDLLPKLIGTNRVIIPGTVNEGISK